MKIDPKLDLVLERTVDASPERVWTAWTKAEHVKRWWTPRPWTTSHCELDLRPGGTFLTVMADAEGKDQARNAGCFLEIAPQKKIVWTTALLADYRPAGEGSPIPFRITATILFEASGSGTKYTAIVQHSDEASCKKHAEMGFADGWGTVFDQLFAYVKSL